LGSSARFKVVTTSVASYDDGSKMSRISVAAGSMLVLVILFLIGLSIATYWIFHPPPLLFASDEVLDLGIPTDASASVALALQARKLIGTDNPRVTSAQGVIAPFLASVDVYVNLADWEKVAFPDRQAVTSILARTWCSRIKDRTRLTSVTVRDMRTGQAFQTCYCE